MVDRGDPHAPGRELATDQEYSQYSPLRADGLLQFANKREMQLFAKFQCYICAVSSSSLTASVFV